MAAYDLEEQEQLDELKTWWKMYGNLVTGFLLVVALAMAGWQGWNWWQRQQAVEASAVFANLQAAAMQRDAKRVRELAGELVDKYSVTAYAGMGALLAARVQVDTGDARNARVQLAWAAENAKDPGLRELARLRLATLLLDEKSYDEAMKQLAAEPAAPFAPRFAELRGDILAAQGKAAEARDAYDSALTKLAALAKDDEASQRAGYKDVLEAKRDALGAAK
ncbi:tetratricopeptide repeat protein [Sulfuritalea sp.]|uniref:YfgM family protein n=1 Tax=Sulfuritalea sp. TaxID=2480090 RepID=UPI001AD2F34F|nr:tetratricopeptide repeat protein [Sulfuritalea sp.]MBN8476241.1 tetratricopeptide repeat protein [Sulfuritalea sp.]